MIDAMLTDAAALAARSPSEVALYLRANGWQSEAPDGIVVRWTKVHGGDEFEVVQPLDPGLRDYPSRVHDVVQVLALVEGRSELDILQHISRVSTDVHLVRVFRVTSHPGSSRSTTGRGPTRACEASSPPLPGR